MTPTSFAYPYGDIDERAVAAAERHYERSVTTRLAPLGETDSPHRLPRLDAYYFRDGHRLQTWGTTRFERYVTFRRGLRRVRRAWTK